MRVSTAEFISRVNDLTDQAETEPVTITQGGRDRLVLVSAEEYARLVAHGQDAPAAEDSSTSDGAELVASRGEMPDLWGALRGTTSWDKDSDITEPTREVWDAER